MVTTRKHTHTILRYALRHKIYQGNVSAPSKHLPHAGQIITVITIIMRPRGCRVLHSVLRWFRGVLSLVINLRQLNPASFSHLSRSLWRTRADRELSGDWRELRLQGHGGVSVQPRLPTHRFLGPYLPAGPRLVGTPAIVCV